MCDALGAFESPESSGRLWRNCKGQEPKALGHWEPPILYYEPGEGAIVALAQILFCLVDFNAWIHGAIVTAQYEVARRIVALANDTDYSILSVVLQLYASPKLLFEIPSQAFYPVPKVDAGVIQLTFDKKPKCAPLILKRILRDAFGQRRKKLKSSLATLLSQVEIPALPHGLGQLRPQQLSPQAFEQLALWIQKSGTFRQKCNMHGNLSDNRRMTQPPTIEDLHMHPDKIWRQAKHGDASPLDTRRTKQQST
ncbi:bifunctional Ribosomal RNA adenine methyltransferase KsgA-Erm/rRNA adenine dimethylase-like [Babesia duncani]|uniref:rRNA adenine N(6)-methyltransferase n=1 Tax=Babesia duncani TaxID=323732 RepID=A0AAD9UPJ6_9APIC|nr:bifunctional Ribosomal RNA adenine methyltransferase KsgA-Erm/rRNA adenine dimethylase-like [Babesia duncani]